MTYPGREPLPRIVSLIILEVGLLLVINLLQMASHPPSARQVDALGPGLAGMPGAAFLLQDSSATHTATQTATASWTATITTTQTITGTPTPTGSVTTSPTPTATSIETSTPTVTLTSEITLQPSASPTGPTQMDATPVMAETGVVTATTTLIPLPAITYQFPAITATDSLLVMKHQPGSLSMSKHGAATGVRMRLARYWPLGILLLIWMGLAAWFALSQRYG